MSTVVSSTGRTSPMARIAAQAGVIGVLTLGGSILLMLIPGIRQAMTPAYLVAYAFWFGIALGGLMLTMLHHLTGGVWGLLIRRTLEAASLVLIPHFLLILPILLPLLFGADVLYPWTRSSDIYMHVIQEKTAYLNVPFFLLRTVIYFAVWIGLAVILNIGSSRQDKTATHEPTHRLARISGPGLAVSFLLATFAAVDWLMSREPDWYSSIYGAMLTVGWGLCTWASMTIVATVFRKDRDLEKVARPAVFHDLGNLTFAFVILWAYTSFVQYFIIWAGNLTEEIPWYLRRTRGAWWYVISALIVLHFFLPFFLLLMRDFKRRAETLSLIALGILVIHLVDLTWLIVPASVRNPLDEKATQIDWLTVVLVPVAFVGIGGVCVASFLTVLRSRPMVPLNDPAMERLSMILHTEALEREYESSLDDAHGAPAVAGG